MQALIKPIYNNEGHTIIEAMISLVVLLVLASVISLLIAPLQKQPTSTQFEESGLFFSMLGKEVREGIAIEVKNNGLYITQPSGDVLSFTKYHSLIRKQVNGLGHEVWVQNIQGWRLIVCPKPPCESEFMIVKEKNICGYFGGLINE